METRGGSTYVHGFHSWGTEGTVVTHDGAFAYQRVYDEHHTIVLWCIPLSGNFNPTTDNTLSSSSGRLDTLDLADGATAVLDREQYVVTTSSSETLYVPATTVVRTAFQMCVLARDEKWLPNLHSVLRGRFTADKVPETALLHAQQLCVMLADRMALCYRRSVVGDPQSYGALLRPLMGWYVALTTRLPDSWHLILVRVLTNLRKLIWKQGPRLVTSWAWKTVRVPTYEVHWDQVCAKLVDAQNGLRVKQPFRNPGATLVAAPPRQPSSTACPNQGQSACGDREASTSSSTKTSPGPSDGGSAKAPAVPSLPKCSYTGKVADKANGRPRCFYWKNPACRCSAVSRDSTNLPSAPKSDARRLGRGSGGHSQKKKSAGSHAPLANRANFRGPTRQFQLPAGTCDVSDRQTQPPVLQVQPDVARTRVLETQREPVVDRPRTLTV
ncbi:hypothetical protein 1 [Wenzhou tombus-like virus 18]|uniref:hypothetical protein 1 n=1 Tax=Wenzhou tombus-like virus 18 TaxID=1923671 RepID=UPI00090C534F|nr:hypothetical protein 1 [Wenzhou tombus-like virus 18]APG76096.1 hypothetical protein 1 [Wenzhou tombus-like virus 18]